MKLFFLSPGQRCGARKLPLLRDDAGQRSGIYLHMLREKQPSELATNRSNGARLWEASEVLLHRPTHPATTHERGPAAP